MQYAKKEKENQKPESWDTIQPQRDENGEDNQQCEKPVNSQEGSLAPSNLRASWRRWILTGEGWSWEGNWLLRGASSADCLPQHPGALQGNRNGREKAAPVHQLPGLTSSRSEVTSPATAVVSKSGRKEGLSEKSQGVKSVGSPCIRGEPGVGGCASELSAQLQGGELLQLRPGQTYDSASAACCEQKVHTCYRGLEEGGGQSRTGTFWWQVSNLQQHFQLRFFFGFFLVHEVSYYVIVLNLIAYLIHRISK